MNGQKNILLLVVDCARSEKTIVDLPGATKATRRSAPLPFVERLRTAGTTWTHFNAVSSTTTPNFATLFTGLRPVQHGIQEHSRYSLLGGVSTLAERLRDAGYHTYAEMTGPMIRETGLDRGFHHYRCRERTEYLHEGFLAHLARLWPTLVEPWFLCLHLWEAHEPYQNPPPFDREEKGLTSYDRALAFADWALSEAFGAFDLDRAAVVYCGDHGERLREDYELNEAQGGSEMAVLRARDRFLAGRPGPFDFDAWFDALRSEFDEATARIYAHCVVGHGFHLTEDLIRTPLIIADRDRCEAGAIRDDLRSQTDLYATLLDLAGLPVPAPGDGLGRSLLAPGGDEMVYIEANGGGGASFRSRCYLRGARDGRFKYWRVEAAGVEHRVLWDLAADPRETVNVAAARPDVCARMDRFVDEQLRDRRSQLVDLATPQADAVARRLRDLGYI